MAGEHHLEAMSLRPDIEDPRVVANLILLAGLIAISRGDLERAVPPLSVPDPIRSSTVENLAWRCSGITSWPSSTRSLG